MIPDDLDDVAGDKLNVIKTLQREDFTVYKTKLVIVIFSSMAVEPLKQHSLIGLHTINVSY